MDFKKVYGRKSIFKAGASRKPKDIPALLTDGTTTATSFNTSTRSQEASAKGKETIG
jgi:heterodisulfide reductase subunit A-like polyferredoxin